MDTMDNFLESIQDNDENIFEEISGYTDTEEEAEDTAGTEPEEKSHDEEPNDSPEVDMVYTTQQVASMVNIAKQTVLNYVAQFPEFIRPSCDSKKQRYFSSTDIEVIRCIAALNTKKEGQNAIKEKLCLKFPELAPEKDQNAALSVNPGSNELMKKEFAAKIEEFRNFFNDEMKNISTRLDSFSDSLNGINDALQNQAEATAKNESLVRGIETVVSHSVDAINDMNRNVTSKMDRSISRNETSINKMQESLDRTNDLLTKEIKEKINKNIDGISGIQKDMERIKSNNIGKKVDDLGKTFQETMDAEKKEREKQSKERAEQNKELFRMIEKSMTPPEYHPENSKEYKTLNDKYNSINETLERTKTALMNMQAKIDEQEDTIAEQEKRINAQKTQISAYYRQLDSCKSRLKACEEENATYRQLIMKTEESKKNGNIANTDNTDNKREEAPGMPEHSETAEKISENAEEPITETKEDENPAPASPVTVSYKESPEKQETKEKPAPDDLKGQVLLNNTGKPGKIGFLTRLFFH